MIDYNGEYDMNNKYNIYDEYNDILNSKSKIF